MTKLHIYDFNDPDLPTELQKAKRILSAPEFGKPQKMTGLQKARAAVEAIKRKALEKKERGKQLAFAEAKGQI